MGQSTAAARRVVQFDRSRLGPPALLFATSSALVLLGGYVIAKYVRINRCTGHYFGYSSWLSNWDGQWYQFIAHNGYHYLDSAGYGPQVFFPLYPLLGWLLDVATPMHGQLPLLVISWLAAWGFCLVWVKYAELRLSDVGSSAPIWGLALIVFWPVSYFLRVAYTESLYLLLLALFFLACCRQWPAAVLIAVTGLLTATRPTAIIACVVLALHLFRRHAADSLPRRLLRAAAAALASAWGLIAYMGYLQWEFGDALLFVKRQAAWNYGMPANVFFLRWEEMLSLRPAWQFLIDGSLLNPSTYPWNLQNRGLWLAAVGLVAVAAWKRWFTAEELTFSALMVALVYYTHGPKNMESVGRYLFTLLPLYLVLTRLLMASPVAARLAVLAGSAFLLLIQSAHFRLWHCVF